MAHKPTPSRKPAPASRTQSRQPAPQPVSQKSGVPAVAQQSRPPVAGAGGREAPGLATQSQTAGRGVSMNQGDDILPILKVLQPLSPECDSRHERFVDGAIASMIYLRGAMNPLVDGDEGVLMQPCHYFREWQLWRPREAGGGLLGRWVVPDGEQPEQCLPEGAEVVEGSSPVKYRIGDDDLIFVRTFIVNVWRGDEPPMPFMIPLSSTGHSVARSWTSLQKKKLLPDGRIADAWACLYHATTVRRQNQKGTWYVLGIQDITEDGEFAGWASDEQYRAGESLFNAFQSGAVKAGVDEDAMTYEAGSGGGEGVID